MFFDRCHMRTVWKGAILNQALCKSPPNMKKSWSFFTIKRNCYCLILTSDWKKRPKCMSVEKLFLVKQKSRNPLRQKLPSEYLHPALRRTMLNFLPSRSALIQIRYGVWRFSRKITLLKGFNFSAEITCLLSCPKARKCAKLECESTHNVFLHGADRISRSEKKENKSSTGKKPAKKLSSSCSASVQVIKGLSRLMN